MPTVCIRGIDVYYEGRGRGEGGGVLNWGTALSAHDAVLLPKTHAKAGCP